MLLALSYSESAYPTTPPLEATLYDHFGISAYFVYYIFIYVNNNKFTYNKFQNCEIRIQHSRYVLVKFHKIVYFLDKHRRKRDILQHLSIVFYSLLIEE